MVLKIPTGVTVYNFDKWIVTKSKENYVGVKKWLHYNGNAYGWIVLSSVIEWIFFGGNVIDWINSDGNVRLWVDFHGDVDLWLSKGGTIETWCKYNGNLCQWITNRGNYYKWIEYTNFDFKCWLDKYKLQSWIEWELSGGTIDSWCYVAKLTEGIFKCNINNIEKEYFIKNDYLEIINIM